MSGYVNLCFDDEGSSRVKALQQMLADQDISHFASWLNYPPHFSLVRVDDAEPELLIPAAKQLLERLEPIEVWLAGFSLFAGVEPVIWLSPVPDIPLINHHQNLCREIEPLRIHTLYQARNWMPHVTIAADLDHDRAVEAVSALLPVFKPISVSLSRIEVVSFPPADIIWSESIAR